MTNGNGQKYMKVDRIPCPSFIVRRVMIALAVLSALLCAVTLWEWYRSYWFEDRVGWIGRESEILLVTYRGGLVLHHGRYWQVETFPHETGWDVDSTPTAASSQLPGRSFLGFGYARDAISGFVEHGEPDSPEVAYRQVRCPFWFLALIFALGPLRVTMLVRGRWRRERRAAGGLCVACGYDLRASAGRCPECGTERRVAD
jgi:hypothetical protein